MATWITAHDWTPTGDVTWTNFDGTFRQVIQAAQIDVTGSQIRLTFQASTRLPLRVQKVFVGRVDGTNPSYSRFALPPTQIFFDSPDGPSPGFETEGPNQTITSRPVNFNYNPAAEDALCVSFFVEYDGDNRMAAGIPASGALEGVTVHYMRGDHAGDMPADYAPNFFIYAGMGAIGVVSVEMFGEASSVTDVSADLRVSWNTAGANPAITKHLSLLWDFAGSVDVSKLSFSTLVDSSSIVSTSKVSFSALLDSVSTVSVSKISFLVLTTTDAVSSLVMLWDDAGAPSASADFSMVWNYHPDVSRNLTFSWNVANYDAVSSLEILWDDEEPVADVSADFSFVWDILEVIDISENLELIWDLEDGPRVSRDLAMRWHIYNVAPPPDFAQANIGISWDIAQSYVDPSRVVYPDFPITEVWGFQTSVFRSISGKEQRRSHRANPIITYQYSALSLDAEGFRQIRQAVEIDVTTFYPVPMFQYFDWPELATASDTRLYFRSEIVNPVVGGYIAIGNDGTLQTKFYEVTAVYADGCDILTPVGFDTTEANFVCPVRICRINNEAGSRLAPVHANTTYSFVSVDRDVDFLRAGAAVSLPMVDDLLLLDAPISAETDLIEDYLSGVVTQDNGKATPRLYVDEPTRRRFDAVYVVDRLIRPDWLDFWRTFALATCGQWKPFAIPTYRADAVPASAPALGSGSVKLLDRAAYDIFTAGGYCGLMFDTPNGRQYRKVSGVALDGNDTVCTLSEPIGNTAGDNDFDVVSFLMLARLGEDTLTLVHTDVTTTINFKIQMTRV